MTIAPVHDASPVDDLDCALLWQLENGLPLVARPFDEIGKALGMAEDEVITRLSALVERGIVKRFGLVVRHQELGYRANAMVVWNVPDPQVQSVADVLSASPSVTLCYRRPRRLPDWPYNLFSMIHGHDRDSVRAHINTLRSQSPLRGLDHDVLFSCRRFKQTGARYQPRDKAREVA